MNRIRLGEVAASIDERLFGQFLERASFGEPGPEAAADPVAGRLRPDALALMKDLAPPLLRFPGGTDIDGIDWRDMIDHAPSREAPARPLTTGHTGKTISNRFGVHEFLALCQELGSTPLWSVKLMSAFTGVESLESVAFQAAALVAYVNAPLEARLPPDLAPYPQHRALNGRREPWGVQLWQIGNEPWFKTESLLGKPEDRTAAGDRAASEIRYTECIRAVMGAMLEVDPGLQFIIDGPRHSGETVTAAPLGDPWIRSHLHALASHQYAPGPLRLPQGAAPEAEALWCALVAMPGECDGHGQSRADASRFAHLASLGLPIAVTEWNWNGYFPRSDRQLRGLEKERISMLGAMGYFHGLLRHADRIAVAAQSLVLGKGWDIALIRYDRDLDGVAHYAAHGAAMRLYRHHHGGRLVDTVVEELSGYAQPLRIGWGQAHERVAWVDLVATAGEDRLHLHLINRHREQVQELHIDPGQWRAGGAATWRVLASGALGQVPVEVPLVLGAGPWRLAIPAGSVSVLSVPLVR